MADRVQYILDGMANVLREVEDLCIFAPAEVKSIVKQRTDREYILIRRKLEIRNFTDYLEYEMKLEKLLGIRCGRLSNTAPGDKVDAMRRLQGAFFKHICYIFDRAVRRFPGTEALWGRYISYLKEKNASKVLNKVYGRVLALYPKKEAFWIDAATHELRANNNALSARLLYQRALRANKMNRILFLKYFELEVWYVLRGMQRKIILNLPEERDTRAVFAVPLVVFKHATAAISDRSFAFLLHDNVVGVADDLAEVIMDILQSQLSNEPAFWLYRCNLKSTELQALHSSFKHSRVLVASTAHVLTVLRETFEVVSSGFASVRSVLEKPEEARSFAFSIGHELQKFCYSALECLGECLVSRTLKGYPPEPFDNEKKKEIGELKNALSQALVAAHEMGAEDGKCDDTHGHGALCEEAMVMMERLALGDIPGKYSYSPRNPLAVWLASLQSKVEQDVDMVRSGQGLSETAQVRIEAWATASSRALKLTMYTWSDSLLKEAPSEEDSEARKAVVHAQATRITAGSDLLVSTEEGVGLLYDVVDAFVSIGDVEAALACVARVMKSSQCPSSSRGDWWHRYLHLSISALGWEAIGPVVAELQRFFGGKPLLKAGTSFTPFFSTASNTLLVMLRGQKKYNLGVDSAMLSAANMISSVALHWDTSDDAVPSNFYDYAAEVQTMMGNHKAANDIKTRQRRVAEGDEKKK